MGFISRKFLIQLGLFRTDYQNKDLSKSNKIVVVKHFQYAI